ncbi:hypothetical protein DFR86_11700 [Acidianus sulfidivorans JP7]|uniref:Uncharacterized protein n=1 Tax=Acidianus sulfidivorans JP7 TaxID=619593 RepID=A0A2U9IQ88_9CREN|nr:hypothetical protein [Acidianus sulfidivorans]AWR98134.1 hypothetical protein DFR86_11700 [Acidianus sulfidivorans JP7]
MLRRYEDIVPKLINEFKKDASSVGFDYATIIGSMRIEEMIEDPDLAKLMSLIFPTSRARINSLRVKIAKANELWVLGKVILSLHELGAKVTKSSLIISHTSNIPAVVMRCNGKYIHILYQPLLKPHTIKRDNNKRQHVIPDIALYVSDNVEYKIGYLENHANRVVLLVENKLSLTGESEYERIDTAIEQVREYGSLLNSPVIVTVYDKNEEAVKRLNSIQGVKCIDNLNPSNVEGVKKFKNLIKEIVKKKVGCC